MTVHLQTPFSHVPRATYRLQFNEHFTLADGLALVPYLEELGISHVYASPLFLARAHSAHGYDVCDFSQLNPELGTESDLSLLAAALRERGMALMLDIVPNHMGVWAPENRWWWDVLANGPESPFARCFDIDWHSPDPQLRGKVLAPLLADDYDRVLETGALTVARHKNGFVLCHGELCLPLTPCSVPDEVAQAGASGGPDKTIRAWLREINENHGALDNLIRRQYYLPVSWREADARLNYRRFFGISSLAGVRVEDERVFKETHSLVRDWLKHGWIAGLRVDHPDGLRDPGQYLNRLRQLAPGAWIVVEKILEPGEILPNSWPVAGTTGYDFLNIVNGLFVAPAAEKSFTDFYVEFTGEPADYEALVLEKKRLVMGGLFIAEVDRLAALLVRIASQHRDFSNFTVENLRDAISEMAASFPVYRTYVGVSEGAIGKTDIVWIERADATARHHRPDLDPKLFNLLRDLLLLRLRGETEDEFVARFQQLTGPVMAKGVEDSAIYCYNRLASLNEVGGNPARFGATLDEFHEFCQRQQSRRPNAMVATSTHDTKRSEDVRARINLLSEIPEKWFEAVRRWTAMNARHRRDGWPDRNAEYLFYQTLVGAWPLSPERALAYMEKASCEAGQHTSWGRRNPLYDAALRTFVAGALGDVEFVKNLEIFLAPLAGAGYINSLTQTLLKLTAPGVPDIYQGCDLWDLSLVDPDNRRSVDFELRRRLLAESKNLTPEEIWQRRDVGLPKLWLIQRVLTLRRLWPGLFDGSSRYDPLYARGSKADHAVAFIRGEAMASVAPRLTLGLNNDWEDTVLQLPEGHWHNELTGDDVLERSVSLTALLRKFPVAMLVRKEGG